MQKIAVTLREATALSGIGRSSIYKLFSAGKLTRRKAGKRTLILVAELEGYLKSLPVGGRADASRKTKPRGAGLRANDLTGIAGADPSDQGRCTVTGTYLASSLHEPAQGKALGPLALSCGEDRSQGVANASPLTDGAHSARHAMRPLCVARRPEKADDYPDVVAKLNSRWRVIRCRDGVQLILQQRKGQAEGRPQWKNWYFCRTRSGLLNCIREYCGPTTSEEHSKL